MTGIFKNWPVEDVVINITRVRQLREISFKTVSSSSTGCSCQGLRAVMSSLKQVQAQS